MTKTVFVVDDSDICLYMADETLSKYYNVFTLPSAEGMFELMEDVRPDLILLDIEMPGTDGFAALKRLKSKEEDADIPVIFLSGRNDASTEARCREMGATGYIAKPFSEPALLECVNSAMQRR